ncbi:MAG: hypothetical protein IJL21_00540 [Alphaproteobacteria bacterium]|nr:hypothetical protein [Alphaproteobacteria bacterium]
MIKCKVPRPSKKDITIEIQKITIQVLEEHCSIPLSQVSAEVKQRIGTERYERLTKILATTQPKKKTKKIR